MLFFLISDNYNYICYKSNSLTIDSKELFKFKSLYIQFDYLIVNLKINPHKNLITHLKIFEKQKNCCSEAALLLKIV